MKKYSFSKSFDNLTNTTNHFGDKNFIFDNKNKIYFSNQVHGNKVHVLKNDSSLDIQKDADSIITTRKDCYVAVRTADCVPILLSDKSGTFVAAVHAGWRGTFYKVLEKTMQVLIKDFNSESRDIIAVIGPSIGICCYEVSKSLWLKFDKKFKLEKDDFKLSNGKYYLNLQNINKGFLHRNGVKNVEILPNCTQCNANFYSYRRDGSTDKSQISIIKLN